MKFYRSFVNQTLLSLALLTSSTLSTQAQALTSSNLNWSNIEVSGGVDLMIDRANTQENLSFSPENSQATALSGTLIAAADTSAESSSEDQGFLSKKTAKIEFIFALSIIVGSLFISERMQRIHEQQQSTTDTEQVNNYIAKNQTETKNPLEK